MLFMAFEAFFMGLMALSAEFLLSSLAWWAIMVGNVLATLTMGAYLWAKHPKLREALAANPMDKTSGGRDSFEFEESTPRGGQSPLRVYSSTPRKRLSRQR